MSGTINVPGYTQSNRVPGVFAVVDATQANTGQFNQVSLLIGQMLEGGTAQPGVPVISAGVGDAQTAFGPGSLMAIAIERYRALDPYGTVICLPQADAQVTLSTSSAQGAAGPMLPFLPGFVGQIALGQPVSGTSIQAGTIVQGINPTTGAVTLSLPTTAAVAANTAITFGSGSKATGTITFSGTVTAAGTLPLMIDGNSINIGLAVGDTAAQVGPIVAAEMNAFTTAGGNPLPMVATAAGAVVTLTHRHVGTLGNQSTINLSYYGTALGQGQPGTTNVPGLTAAVVAFAGGAGDPDFAPALANLPAQPYDFIYCPYNDPTSLGYISAFLNESGGRWNWQNMLFGVAWTAFQGTLAARSTWGTENNNQFLTAQSNYGSPSPAWHWAIDYMAAGAVSIRANPSVPVGGLAGGVGLNVVRPPLPLVDSFQERAALLYDGISTYVTNPAGQVAVDRAITTYQTNAAGDPDSSFLSLNVPYQLMAWIRGFRSMIQSKYNQRILVSDGTKIPAGSAMVTSQTLLTSVLGYYSQTCNQGLTQNATAFAAAAKAMNAGNGLVTMMLPVNLAGQLINVAADIQFLQS